MLIFFFESILHIFIKKGCKKWVGQEKIDHVKVGEKWVLVSVRQDQITGINKLLSPVIMCSLFFLTGCISVEDKKVVKQYHGHASWYQCCGKTASGQKFNPNDLTVAHRHLPFGTILRLTNVKNGNTIEAIVNDRGPFIKGREIDVSRRTADVLGFRSSGTAKLMIEVLK